eukprot:TRINITY_DN55955_c0_g1_i1.p1 TRINITY_DN55955_c0_g1~~TRINITY_DN55955_c0_g1_i1.p1  ORF type:complete len:371 (+),score=43.57 TRINITY_DN55955_c0_g1_i1:88-1200(+)
MVVLGSDTEGCTDNEEGGTDSDGAEYDDFGFVLPPPASELCDKTRAYAEWFRPKAQRRLRRFEARRQKLATPGVWTTLPKSTMKGLLRKGLPSQHRSEVWWSILGCDLRQQSEPGCYQTCLNQTLVSPTDVEIERDLPRTFPNNRTFCTEAGRGQLRNVLHAFASHAPKVRYCQGLNYIAGLLLLVFLDEERAFWALVCAMDRLGVEGYYTDGMKLLRADMRVLFSVMMRKCSKVARRIQDHNVDLLSICSAWYITWFAKCMPIGTILRVWDTLFFEGYKILFRVAIAVFKRAEREVLQCTDFGDIMERAQKWPNSIQHNELLKTSFGGIPLLRRRDLIQAREQALAAIGQDDDADRKRIQERERTNNVL